MMGADNDDMFQLLSGSASEYRERCIETWSELFRPSEDVKPSNTFITEGKLDVKPDLEESGSAFPETDGRKSKSAAAVTVSVDDIYCFTDRKIGLVEQMLSNADNLNTLRNVAFGPPRRESDAGSGQGWPACSYLLCNGAKNAVEKQ